MGLAGQQTSTMIKYVSFCMCRYVLYRSRRSVQRGSRPTAIRN